MADSSGTAPTRLWTIGHSNYEPDELLDLLRGAEIAMVVDVRSTPYSKHASQFNRERLDALLGGAGVAYQYEGQGLGGRPEGDAYYDSESHALYYRVAQMPEFGEAIQRVMAHAESGTRVALVCVEEDPLECHRTWFLGRALGERGVELLHIRRDGREQTDAELEYERTQGQVELFASEEEVWRSPMPIPRRGDTGVEDL